VEAETEHLLTKWLADGVLLVSHFDDVQGTDLDTIEEQLTILYELLQQARNRRRSRPLTEPGDDRPPGA
jgi:hypothetical protein